MLVQIGFCVRVVVSCFAASYSPPERFDYEPKVRYEVIAIPHDKLQNACWVPDGMWVWACVGPNYIPTIYILDSLEGEAREIILRHEKAHINGWDNNHPR